jgi:hypothetical protein
MAAIDWIKKIYVYIFATVGLVLMIIGSVQLISLGLKAYVFTKADIQHVYPMAKPALPNDTSTPQQPDPQEVADYQLKELESSRQRQAAGALAMLIVGIPLFAYHFRIIRKDF